MAKLTWLGEQDYGEGETPLSACTWNGVLFTAGDKVEISDPWMIAKARGNRFFRVENGKEPAPLPENIRGTVMRDMVASSVGATASDSML